MKRFYTFLALLLTLTTTWAQTLLSDCTPLSSETIPTGYYFIASTESSLYEKADPFIAEQNGALCLVNKADVTNDLSTSSLGVWYITNTGIKKTTQMAAIFKPTPLRVYSLTSCGHQATL